MFPSGLIQMSVIRLDGIITSYRELIVATIIIQTCSAILNSSIIFTVIRNIHIPSHKRLYYNFSTYFAKALLRVDTMIGLKVEIQTLQITI